MRVRRRSAICGAVATPGAGARGRCHLEQCRARAASRKYGVRRVEHLEDVPVDVDDRMADLRTDLLAREA